MNVHLIYLKLELYQVLVPWDNTNEATTRNVQRDKPLSIWKDAADGNDFRFCSSNKSNKSQCSINRSLLFHSSK